MGKSAPLTRILGSSRTVLSGHLWARRYASFRAGDDTKGAVRMRRLAFIPSGSQRDADCPIQKQFKPRRTRGTQPEELRVRRLPFERIKIAPVKMFEFSTADPINAAVDDNAPPRFRGKSPIPTGFLDMRSVLNRASACHLSWINRPAESTRRKCADLRERATREEKGPKAFGHDWAARWVDHTHTGPPRQRPDAPFGRRIIRSETNGSDKSDGRSRRFRKPNELPAPGNPDLASPPHSGQAAASLSAFNFSAV